MSFSFKISRLSAFNKKLLLKLILMTFGLFLTYCKSKSNSNTLIFKNKVSYYNFIKSNVSRIGDLSSVDEKVKEINRSFERLDAAIRIVEKFGDAELNDFDTKDFNKYLQKMIPKKIIECCSPAETSALTLVAWMCSLGVDLLQEEPDSRQISKLISSLICLLITRPVAPCELCSKIKTTDFLKRSSGICGIAIII